MITKDRLDRAVKGESQQPKPDPRVAKASSKTLAIIQRYESAINLLQIQTPEQYIQMDQLRARVEEEIAAWDGLIEPIIRPQRQALDATYALGRTVKRPLEKLKAAARQKMEQYKLEEARQIRQLGEKLEQQQRVIEAEVQVLQKQLDNAVTPALKKRIEGKINTLQDKAWTAQDETATPVEAEGSTTRYGYEWALTNIKEAARAVASGKIPPEALIVDSSWLNKYFAQHPEEVMEWPGFEVKEAVSIVKKRP